MFTRISRRFVGISDDALMYTLFTLFGVAVGISLASYFFSQGANLLAWFDSFFQNFGTEMFGAFLTFWLIEMLRGSRRERERAEQEAQERKAQLIRQMGSDVWDVAVLAVEELRTAGWLYDGSLKGARLGEANLQGARLWMSNLQEAFLIGANLQGADLRRANLQGADLDGASLQGAWLSGSNLEGATLREANLQHTSLEWANLQGADLRQANLEMANLQGAEEITCDQLREASTLRGATLPDGTKLPSDDTWREAFEAWCETVETDKNGYIKVD